MFELKHSGIQNLNLKMHAQKTKLILFLLLFLESFLGADFKLPKLTYYRMVHSSHHIEKPGLFYCQKNAIL